MFSIIADEATDVSHNEQPCVHFISSMLCTKTDASTIAGIIKDCMLHIALPISQCRGQAYNGATTMKGQICGIAAVITCAFKQQQRNYYAVVSL